mmetsp:Transcript_1038/g.3374  ORF Transcript_1038/g.3374 Transcript_1038/m.3374 type:complete len:387 (-) Transcript_1038:132-1292(-)
MGVTEGVDEDLKRAPHHLVHVLLWAVQNLAKGHGGGLAEAPVGVLDVGGDERHGELRDLVSDGLGNGPEADRRGIRQVPVVGVRVLLLLAHGLQEAVDQATLGGRRNVVSQLLVALLLLDLDFHVGDRGPELDGHEAHVLGVRRDGLHAQAVDGLDVRGQVPVVQGRDASEAFKSQLAGLGFALRRLAGDPHDHVALTLALKVLLAELERILQRRQGGLAGGLGATHFDPVHNSRQDLVRVVLVQSILLKGLAHVTTSLERRLLGRLGDLGGSDALKDPPDQSRPGPGRNVHACNGADALRCGVAHDLLRVQQALQERVPDMPLGLSIHGAQPTLPLLLRVLLELGRHNVLQLQTSQLPDMNILGLIGQLADQRKAEGRGLVPLRI